MSNDSALIIIKNKGTITKPNFVYITGKEEIQMGSLLMYNKFSTNFSDSVKTSGFFSRQEGITMLTTMLTSPKCPIFIESEKDNAAYIASVKVAFDIIQGFTSNLSTTGKTKETHKKYVDLFSKMQEKANLVGIKGTVAGNSLIEIAKSLTSVQRSTVRDISQITQVQGSIDSAKTNMVNSAVINHISKTFLSPIDPSVFDIVRDFCIQYIGEGKKVSEESGHNLDVLRTNLLYTVGLFRHNLTYKASKIDNKTKVSVTYDKSVDGETNANDMNNVNNVLIALFTNPQKARLLIKIMKKMVRFYPNLEEDIPILEDIFAPTLNGNEFTNNLSTSFVYRPFSSYLSGTKDHPNSITRTTTIDEKVIEAKEVQTVKNTTILPNNGLKTTIKPKSFFTNIDSSSDDSESDSDEDSNSDSDNEENLKNRKLSGRDVESSSYMTDKKNKKTNQITITKVISIDEIFVPLTTMKRIVKFLNEGLNSLASQENKRKAMEIIKAIDEGIFGDVKADLVLDWWQDLFIEKTKRGESFVLVGDTSGGKTFISLMAMRILFNQYINESMARFIYLAPTPQLAVLQFANILTAYPNYSSYFGICCKSIVNVPDTARILIGTPNEVKKYLTEIKYQRDTIVTSDNLKEKMTEAISRPRFENCRTLLIDEIQTWSRTYVQDVEAEQVMECKAIEEIMQLVDFEHDSKSQVIGMSATLSPISIANIKNRISELTHIPVVSDIIYAHKDIGLTVREDGMKPGYTPIMKKPEIRAIKIEGSTISDFRSPVFKMVNGAPEEINGNLTILEEGENIYNQTLDARAVEMIIRDAEAKQVLPIAFFRESELSAIQMYKDHIDHMESKDKACTIWHSLHKRYNDDMNIIGYNKMKEPNQIEKWTNIIKENIINIISDINVESVVNIARFEPYKKYIEEFDKGSSVNYSPELYGLLVEYAAFKTGIPPFGRKVHPYYRFGTVVNANNFFSLEDSKKAETNLKKILMAQDADPSTNTGSIIPLIMRGIEYGCGILTSSVPLGIQLELYKFINIKGKSDSNPIPILFCEYGMSMGMNTSIMSVCICRYICLMIGASEFKQIGGRPGRRGNSNGRAPVIYTFNISNTYLLGRFENLGFELDDISSNFFTPSEIHDYFAKLIVKYENNKVAILEKSESIIENIISGDTFKGLGGSDVLLVRKIQIAKYQVREIFNNVHNLNPNLANTVLKAMYSFLQRAELYSLNVQIR